MVKRLLVTGGTGFIGSALVRRLVRDGFNVRVLDDDSRGAQRRLADIVGHLELIVGDIRDPQAVSRAVEGVECVWHLAYINGTEYFYTRPELVLEVGVKGITNVLDACIKHGVSELVLASSSEVYQQPPIIPTPENVPMVVPDVRNPRYSYGAGKIISEVMAYNNGKRFKRLLTFRPHNVVGPDMGWEHVIPQFTIRMKRLAEKVSGRIDFPIQGNGSETRSFIYIDDCIDALMQIFNAGAHLDIFHIGTMEEVSIAELAHAVARCLKREIVLVPGPLQAGGTLRRCPDTARLKSLGFCARNSFQDSVAKTTRWYDDNIQLAPVGR
jgi:nucleoside-diphosphate-sugar epimerase